MTERGSTTPLLMVLTLGGALLIAVVVDLGRLATVWTETHRSARAGAEAGAAVVDVDAVYDNRLIVDAEEAATVARTMARRGRPRAGRIIDVDIRPEEVCVRIRQRFRPHVARVIGARPTTVDAMACAMPRSG